MTSAPGGIGTLPVATRCTRSSSTTTTAFVKTRPVPSINLPNLMIFVPAAASDAAARTNRSASRAVTRMVTESDVGQGVVREAADLDVVAKRIGHVEAVLAAVAHVGDAHRFQLISYAVAFEIGNRVADVIDHRRGPGTWRRAVRRRRIQIPGAADDEGERHVFGRHVIRLLALLAEGQRHFGFLEPDLIEVEDFRIPVAGLLQIWAGVRHVVDQCGLDAPWRRHLGGVAVGGAYGGHGHGHRFDQRATPDLP